MKAVVVEEDDEEEVHGDAELELGNARVVEDHDTSREEREGDTCLDVGASGSPCQAGEVVAVKREVEGEERQSLAIERRTDVLDGDGNEGCES